MKYIIQLLGHPPFSSRNPASVCGEENPPRSLAVSDCWDKGSQKALCAADISVLWQQIRRFVSRDWTGILNAATVTFWKIHVAIKNHHFE